MTGWRTYRDLDRAERIGLWVSGVAHAAGVAALIVGGALFRAHPGAAIRMTNVASMSEAEFQSMAAATRGAGPLAETLAVTPARPDAPDAEDRAGGVSTVAPPAPKPRPEALPAPLVAPDAAPDLSELRTEQSPVAVATIAPQPAAPATDGGAPLPGAQDPQRPAPSRLPALAQTPAPLPSARAPDAALPETLPAEPGLAPLVSARPFAVQAARDRRAEAEAVAQAAARAAAQAEAQAAADRAAAAQAAAEAAAAEQARAAQQAAAEAEAAARQAEADARAEAEAEAQAEARARERADAERQAAEAAERAEAEARAAETARVEAAERAAQEKARQEAEARREEEEAAALAAALAQAEADRAAQAEAEAKARDQAEEPRIAPDEPKDALAVALENALSEPGASEVGGGGAAADGPPLSQGEKDGLRLAVSKYWRTGALSRAAQEVRVSIGFAMLPDGTVDESSIRLVDSAGGDDEAVRQAFEIARRAILQSNIRDGGFKLPAAKYNRWKEMILDFSPGGSLDLR